MSINKKARALYDCIGEDDSELTFQINDIISDISPATDPGWFIGKLEKNGEKGLFPGNYVEFIEQDTVLNSLFTSSAGSSANAKASTTANKTRYVGKKMSAAEMRRELLQKSGAFAKKQVEKTPVVEEQDTAKPVDKLNSTKIAAKIAALNALANQGSHVAHIAHNKSSANPSTDAQSASTENPNVPKRPALLVANQKYHPLDPNADPSPSTVKPSAPPIPAKPKEIQVDKSVLKRTMAGSSTESLTGIQKPHVSKKPLELLVRPESTISVLGDGTPFRPNNTPSINVNQLTPPVLSTYKSIFHENDLAKSDKLSGDKVRSIWMKSGLDSRSLGLVWNLSDLDKDGYLSCEEFCIGMFLIDEKLRGVPLPSTLPLEIVKYIRSL